MTNAFAASLGWSRRALLTGGVFAFAGAASAQSSPNVVNNVLIGRDGWLFSNFGEPQRNDLAAVDRVTLDLIREAGGLLRAARVEPVIVLIPSKNRVYRSFTGVAGNPPAHFTQRYANLLAQLRRDNTLAPDLDAVFRRAIAERPQDPLYFRADTHWTPRGAELAATEAARVIREANRLPQSPRPGTRLGNPVEQSYAMGDLQRLLPPDRRGGFQPQPYTIRQPEQGGAASLLDDAPGDVAAIGSSFLEPRYGYVHSLSNQLNRPVQLAWRPNTVGPWATLLEYLRSAEFRAARPRMLLWHHLEIDMTAGPSNGIWGRNAMGSPAFLDALRGALAG